MKRLIRIVKKISQDPKLLIACILPYVTFFPDRLYLQIQWWTKIGRLLNLNDPTGFNEKLQWLKLNDHNPKYTQLVDKYEVRNFVKETIGEQYLIPLLGVWEKTEDIDFNRLPNQFVLKCTHNSGEGMCLCRDKTVLNVSSVVAKLKTALNKNYYTNNREWPYKHVRPRIIAETLIVDKNSPLGSLINYKFYCFNGVPKFLYVGMDDTSKGTKGELYLSILDLEWKGVPFYRSDHKQFPGKIDKPRLLPEMLEIVKKLAKDLPFVRVDLYLANDLILFSELTFFPGAGYGLFQPVEWENKMGSWLQLPIAK